MTEDKESYLLLTFPRLFRESLSFGIEAGDGWFSILSDACAKLEDLKNPDLYFTQIKEKWGLCRVYMSVVPPEVSVILSDLEHSSGNICEACGGAGKLAKYNNWYWATRCSKCASAENLRLTPLRQDSN